MILDPLYVADCAKRIALRDPNVVGNPVLAIMDVEKVEEFSDADMKMMTEKIFRTTDPDAPRPRRALRKCRRARC